MRAHELHLATYHMLWELVHIVLNHRGIGEVVMSGECHDEVCITCSDQLLAVVVTGVDAAGGDRTRNDRRRGRSR